MRTANGYRADLVLNPLVGESLRVSWDYIAPYERMIKIGKGEIDANSQMPTATFVTQFAGMYLYRIV
jgi:hypothetical protein